MKWGSWSFHKKVWAFLLTFTYGSILVSVLLVSYIYQEVYVGAEEERLLSLGRNLATQHTPGELNEDFIQRVEAHNDVSTTQIYVVQNPRELSACLPFEIDYQTFISEEERRHLLNGEYLVKMGYEERIDRNVLAVVTPLVEDRVLDGILYVYVPVSSIQEVFLPAVPVLVLLILVLFVILYLSGSRFTTYVTKPLTTMQLATKKIAAGDFSSRVPIHTSDELGQLGHSFNEMANALEKEDVRKQTFLSNVSHELRTPLSYVKGYSEVLLEDDQLREDQKEFVSIIHNESDRLSKLVNDLLDLAKIQGEQEVLSVEPTVLSALIDEAAASYLPSARKKGIEITTSNNESIIALIDPNRIKQVLHNLIQNSLHHCQSGDSISCTLSLEHSSTCKITITDTGAGMSQEALVHLGERFYRTDDARTRKYGGTGLGVAISKAIIEKHNGTIHYESALGKGTTVMISLPIVDEKDQPND
ncbi:sensor histidine kinase [Alkalihalophilus marmarensis]|uniref:sensor histidine kinase n=1 Tax=Alkalihalophilus marmarensis TaxID=521377 RepID=UPI002DC03E23|nr:HAMP domain-containing sensor histidine kinase [Alkalihalophilus marmarensis]MEC2070575.1 HAMP domain-containing sensor histidine kinase [Alkalihalophilus marmarensis]